ncbi:MAG: cysteine--tRNA ligase [Thermoleophilaceae bacterium]
MTVLLRIQDTLSNSRRTLEPREAGHVGIYACGPTVYAPVHVGNARPYVVFSLLKRYLQHRGQRVSLVVNVTDVNDKIYTAAAESGIASEELAQAMTARYVEDTDRLGLGRPDAEPRASETIAAIIALIESLVAGGHAYAARGDVYFRVSSFAGYGKLSNRSVAEMDQGEDDPDDSDEPALKESPQDFALWKAHKAGEDSSWESPWGPGRPGWHIECSAMAEALLGLDFDIHGGGADLIFPHHENEIAQTEAARGAPLARVWMHNGMVRFDAEKMSKSAGNIRSLAGALDEYGRDALVMYFVRGHYRQPIEFSPQALDEAVAALGRIREFCRRLETAVAEPPALEPVAERFYGELADDFNTPGALAVLFDWIKEGNRRLAAGEQIGAGPLLHAMLECIGLEGLLDAGPAGRPDPAAERLLEERERARAERDFATADRKRDELDALGWEVRDTAEGPQLVRRA